MMKIMFLIPSLRGGGAERVASLLCNNWIARHHEVVLVTYEPASTDFYNCSDKILRYSIITQQSSRLLTRILNNLRRVLRFRKIVKYEQPDVVISFMDAQNMLASIACIFTSVPVIISERTYPPYFNNNNLFDRLRKFSYKFCSAFVAQTSDVANWAQQFLGSKQVKVIPNPLYNRTIPKNVEAKRDKIILAAGRLSRDKGFDLLIHAFKQCNNKYPDWKLLIIGEGQERSQLQAEINNLLLSERVILLGSTQAPEYYYNSAEIFVLSSRVEGFPNVLLEAMASGLATLSFDCNSGPADIIQHGINGLLVPAGDIDAMANNLQSLMADSELRARLAKEATKVHDKYNIELISQQWLELCKKILAS